MILALPLIVAMAAEPAPVERYVVDSTLLLPRPMWMLGYTNQEGRVSEVQLGMVLSCGTTDTGRESVMDCIVEDFALRGAPMPADVGRLESVLTEVDERLTGTRVNLRLKKGRVLSVGPIETNGPSWRRSRRSDETLRLLLSRAVAGFDLKRSQAVPTEPWGQRRTWLVQAPTATGTLGSAQLVHQPIAGEGSVEIRTGGSVALSPATTAGNAGLDVYTGELRALGHLDESGRWLDRRWELVVTPTPDSAIADGPAGLTYEHRGSLRRLGDGERVDLGSTGEIAPTRAQPTALQSMEVLGVAR